MYELYKVSDDVFQIHSNFSNVKAMEGSFVAIVAYMIRYLGFKSDDVEMGMVDMLRKDNDSIHFGLNRTFIYSFKKIEKYGKKSA